MNMLQKVRTSFTTQLSLWVAGFVLLTSGVVIFLLASFSEGVIRDETIDATMQALENAALNIDNRLRQTEMTARLEHQQVRLDRPRIERLIGENGLLATLQQSLPNAQLYVGSEELKVKNEFALYTSIPTARQTMYNNKEYYVFSQPLGDRPFCLNAVCPSEDIYGKYARMQWILLFWGVAAVLALLYILYIVIAHHLRPLHRLADAAQTIAQGDLDTPIVVTHHHDETGRLQNSLSKMQRRLAAYMVEMQQKQDTLNRQHAELQAAYDEAKTYEKKKVKFLRDMTVRMADPVELLCHSTDAICRNYPNLSKTDMTALQGEVSRGSETITALLDQLIKDPAGKNEE